jgi:branched-chain amino acid aminotransferase
VSVGVAPAVVWVNGERQSDDGPHVSARDRGLTLGDGVFETMRARDGTVFRLGRHLARLERSLTVLEIPAPPELHAWVAAAAGSAGDAAGHAAGRDASIRLTVTRGTAPAGVTPPAVPQPTVIITVGPMPSFPASTYADGLSAHVASGRRNEYAMTAGLKTLGYIDAVAGMLEARRAGADEALFLDTEGHCSEASASNLFIATGTDLATPRLSCGVLPGITREAVLELARAEGIAVAERAIGLHEVRAAKEAFLTSSLRGIAPLVRLAGKPIGRAVPGELTRRLAAAYQALVDRECGG